MFCGKCGTPRANNANFCTSCGAACAPQQYHQQPYQQFPQHSPYPPYQPPQQTRPSDVWAWLTAFSPAIISLVWLLILLAIPGAWFILWWFTLGLDISFRLLDMQELKRNNIDTSGMWWHWKPYLLVRQERVRGSSSVLFVVQVVAFIVSIIFDIWMFAYFGIF